MTSTSSGGTCFGFELVSEEPVWFLRDGTGSRVEVEHQKDLDLTPGRLLAEWIPNATNPIEARLYTLGTDTGYALWIKEAGWFMIDPMRSKVITPNRYDTVAGSIRLLGLPLLLCCLARGDTTLHAAAVEVEGSAVLLAAPGKHGKTSLSATFAAGGHRLLSEDLSCLRSIGGELCLIPGPTGLRIRPDMVDHITLPGYEQVGIYGDRIVLRPTGPTGDCTPLPIAAIIFLGDFGLKFDLSPITPEEAIPDFWFLSFHLPTDEDRTRKFQALVDVASKVPAYRLVRAEDRSRLAETMERIIDRVGS